MHYFVYVHLSRFYRDSLPKLPDGAVIVHDGKRVVEVCEQARGMGIVAGFSLVEAKTLAHGSTFVTTEPFSQWEAARQAWTQPLRRFTERIEIHAPNAISLDLGAHPDPYSLLAAIQNAIPKPHRMGIGRAKWLAHLAARHGGIHADWVVRPDRMLAPLHVRVLPFATELTHRLGFLGCRTIRDVQVLSLDTLKNQFGELGRSIQLAAMGQLSDELKPNEGPPTVRVYREIPDGIEDQAMLERLLRDVAKELARGLANQDRRSRVIHAWVNGEKLEVVSPKPLRTATQFHLVLVREIRPEEPLNELVVELHLEDSGHYTQYSIVDPRDQDAVEDAVHRLRTVFGDSAICCASDVQLPRRVHVLRAWQGGT
ncbi:MAG: hypothetical protein IT363_10305 [Methanoregulaceae archaeon]|nr:hypothetical protein [Methanoregulaceae archaeon]